MASPMTRLVVAAMAFALTSCGAIMAQQEAPPTVFRTTVRRVIVDVVVTDKAGRTVPGLSRKDFSLSEDGTAQKVLSFDAVGFGPQLDYTPPRLPAEPPNTFVNLPEEPEKGPLYVLLYDLVNMQTNEEQILARKELIKFINEKPEGSRFAIFLFSDGLHLVQGFTSDKRLLFAAVDPNHSRAHVPKIFLMGRNYGQEDAPTAVWILRAIANFLDGLPGRKNVIWFSGGFPLALFPDEKDNLQYYQDVKQMFDLLARNQIAIYPVDTRGVSVENPHAPPSTIGDANPSAPSGSPGAAGMASQGLGVSQLSSSYLAEEEIARATGGRAFYSRNDIAVALEQATEDGASYYSLSYAPADRDYDAKLHTIGVELAQKGYTLAYRRSYYALDPNTPDAAKKKAGASASVVSQTQPPQRSAGDILDANMRHGAPMAHGLIFGAHMQAVGQPVMGSPAQMVDLAQQTNFFQTRRRSATPKPLPPVRLQEYTIDYTVMAHQFQGTGSAAAVHLEIAAAAYDDDGHLLNATVGEASRDEAAHSGEPPKAYRAQQVLFVPVQTRTIRVAVHDSASDRVGALEVKVPLSGELQDGAMAKAH